jgi:hypothetical protein
MRNKTKPTLTWPDVMSAVKAHLETLTPEQRVDAIFDLNENHGFCEHCGREMGRGLLGHPVCHCQNDE